MKVLYKTIAISTAFLCQLALASGEGQVVQIIAPHSKSPRLLISMGSHNGISSGDVLLVDRPVAGSKDMVTTGRVKVLESYLSQALCDILSEETPASRAVFAKFPKIMAGDFVSREQVNVASVGQIVPEIVITYAQMFLDPKANPSTFELSISGKKELQRVFEEFGNRRVESMVIEAHTDEAGPSEANQIESYQRALTIKQYLVGQFEFKEDRLIVIGQGENERLSEEASMIPEHTGAARRVVFRSVE